MGGSALIQQERGAFVNPNGFTAWQGFDQRGFEIAFYDYEAMALGAIAVELETVVIGSVASVRLALARLGIVPRPIDYPDTLAEFLGRSIVRTTWGEVRARFARDESPPPLFVKPIEADKSFTGYLVAAFRDLIPTRRFPDAMPLWASDPVEFISEWRFIVHHHEVRAVGHYKGDPLVFPAADLVRPAVDTFAPEAPVGYGLDFGRTADGRTLLVEANDGFALGCYGMKPMAYSRLLEDRWRELVRPVAP